MEEGEKLLRKAFIILLIGLLLTGCHDQLYLENAEIALIIAFDLAENGDVMQYAFRPVFEREVAKKYEVTRVQDPLSLRSIRKKVSTITSGFINVRKLQLVLFSKELLKHRNMYPFLDEIYRNPKSELNAKVAVFDGPIEQVSEVPWQSKGRPGVIIPRILDQAFFNGTALLADLLRYRKQLVDPRITPYMPELYYNQGRIRVKGTTLLDKKGIYQLSLNPDESSYLTLLKGDLRKTLSLQFDDLGFAPLKKSFGIEVYQVDRTVHAQIQHDQPQITVDLNLKVIVTERAFDVPIDQKAATQKVEAKLAQAIQQRCQQLLRKLQQHQVDPVGFGYDLKAQQYPWWKKHENKWPEAIAQTNIIIKPKVEVSNYGASM